MKISEDSMSMTLKYPANRTSIIICIAFALPCILVSPIYLLLYLEGRVDIGIVFLADGIILFLGGGCLIKLIQLILYPDKLIINQNSQSITRIFGLDSLYRELKKKKVSYDLSTVKDLYIKRKIRFNPSLIGDRIGPPSPSYHLECGFRNWQNDEIILHKGFQSPITTIKVVARFLERDIIDYTGLEKKIIPYSSGEIVDEIRYPPVMFSQTIFRGFSLIGSLFIFLHFSPTLIQNLSNGLLKNGIVILSRVCFFGGIILLMFLILWIFKEIPEETKKCKQCGTKWSPIDIACSHCNINIAYMRSKEFNPKDYFTREEYEKL